eukprot:1140046-Pelagomonas_calceolata.AAC.3
MQVQIEQGIEHTACQPMAGTQKMASSKVPLTARLDNIAQQQKQHLIKRDKFSCKSGPQPGQQKPGQAQQGRSHAPCVLQLPQPPSPGCSPSLNPSATSPASCLDIPRWLGRSVCNVGRKGTLHTRMLLSGTLTKCVYCQFRLSSPTTRPRMTPKQLFDWSEYDPDA